jgi:hypothetical protein
VSVLKCTQTKLSSRDQAVEQIQAENPKLEITVKKVTDVDSFLDYGLLRLQAITHGGQLLNVAI